MAASNKSTSSVRTSSTSSSVVSVASTRAKEEAAKVRALYASKEAKLKVEKAMMEAELEVLTLQREADAAVGEAQVLEDVETTQCGKSVSESERRKKTRHYVQSQMEFKKPPTFELSGHICNMACT